MDFESCRKSRIQAIEAWWPGGLEVAWWHGGLEAWSSEFSPGHRKLLNPILLKEMYKENDWFLKAVGKAESEPWGPGGLEGGL